MVAYERSMRSARRPSVACSVTTTPPENSLRASKEAIALTGGPAGAACLASNSVPQA